MTQNLVSHVSPFQPERSVPPWWAELFKESVSASLFLSAEWIQAWIGCYGGEFRGRWIRWESDGKVVGGCLLLHRVVWWRLIPQPTQYLNVAAETSRLSPWSEYNQALYLEGYAEAVAASLARMVTRLAWTRFELWGYEANAFSENLLAGLPHAAVQSRQERAPYVDLEAIRGKEYESTLSSKTRPQIRKCRRMYEEQNGPVCIDFASSCEEALEFLEGLATLHNAIWRSRGAEPSFDAPEFMAFHKEVIKRLWPAEAVDLVRVRAKDKVIGYLLNFKRGSKIYCYQSGFVQESDYRLKPGLLTHATAIAEYGRRGFREYDLLGGDSRYKRSLTKLFRTQSFSTCYRDSLYGQALWKARQLKARLKPNAALPASGDEEGGAQDGGPSES